MCRAFRTILKGDNHGEVMLPLACSYGYLLGYQTLESSSLCKVWYRNLRYPQAVFNTH